MLHLPAFVRLSRFARSLTAVRGPVGEPCAASMRFMSPVLHSMTPDYHLQYPFSSISAVDNSAPVSTTLSHLKTRAKQRQVEAEWRSAVHADNMRLLNKLERIGARDIDKITKPASQRTSMQLSIASRGCVCDTVPPWPRSSTVGQPSGRPGAAHVLLCDGLAWHGNSLACASFYPSISLWAKSSSKSPAAAWSQHRHGLHHLPTHRLSTGAASCAHHGRAHEGQAAASPPSVEGEPGHSRAHLWRKTDTPAHSGERARLWRAVLSLLLLHEPAPHALICPRGWHPQHARGLQCPAPSTRRNTSRRPAGLRRNT